MAGKKILTIAQLRELISYNASTGEFRWIGNKQVGGRRRANGIAGTISCLTNGYQRILIRIYGNQYYAHRLAWALVTGKWPEFEIDHVNRNPLDNRWNNLRDVTHRVNVINQGTRNTNTSGTKGVSFDKVNNRWIVHISYATKIEAIRVAKRLYAKRNEALLRKPSESSQDLQLTRQMEDPY